MRKERKERIITIKEDVRIGDIILEAGDKIKIVEARDFVTMKLLSSMQSWSREEIQEMLDDKATYYDADNLPKWIYKAAMTSNNPEFYKLDSMNKVWQFLEEILASNGVDIDISGPIVQTIRFR